MDWATVSAHLQDKGYFTRYWKVGDVEALEVCRPNENVRVDDVIEDLEGIQVKATQIAIWDSRDFDWVRLEEER